MPNYSRSTSNFIQAPQNHVVFVLDESSSMTKHAGALVTVVDNEIKYLANRSNETGQETRVSVFLFSSSGTARCVIYDMDVLRLPSIKELYKPNGMTALCDCTILAIEDMLKTPQKYGQHSFLFYVFTDGMENASTNINRQRIPVVIGGLADNWTFVTFVPDQIAKSEAQNFGFPKDNIAVWDTTSVRGMEEVGQRVREVTNSYFDVRKSGGRGLGKSVFTLKKLSVDEILRNLTPVPRTNYRIFPVTQKMWIRDFINAQGLFYQKGYAYYQLTKNEKIQADKAIIVEVRGQLYAGSAARQLLQLPDQEVLVQAEQYPDYTIFVQSNSVNRNLIPGQRVIYLTGNVLSNFFR
jgi:hypothetical protein